MNRFAELLDRLAYEPGRNNKLRLLTDYFRSTPDPERGFGLAALTGALSFQYAKPSVMWANGNGTAFASKPWPAGARMAKRSRDSIRAPARKFQLVFPT